MFRLTRFAFLLSFLVSACLGPAPRAEAPESSTPPNLVIIFTDDQGYGDLSCFGHPSLRTPHIDSLARSGMKLTQFYVASPVCSPSRAALLTGCYPKRVGMHEHVVFPEYDYGLNPDEVTLADLLRGAGYATGCFGKWHLGHRPGLLPTDQGFDTYFGVPYSNDMSRVHREPESRYPNRLPVLRDHEVIEWEPDQRYLTQRYTDEAVRFIHEHADQPFFVYVPHSMPHIPLYASEEVAGHSPRGLYGDVIEEIDGSVGRILEALEQNGLTEDTLVVFTSDNGPWLPFKQDGGSAGPLRGGKGSNWEGGQRVPCLMQWPARIPAASLQHEVVTTMDLLPTLAALTEQPLPAVPIDGHDVTELLVRPQEASSPTDSFLYYTSKGKLAGLRQGPWKLVLEKEQLFHLEHDISEKWNLAEQHPERIAAMKQRAEELDQAITDQARPVHRVDEMLFEPRAPGFESNE